MRPDACPPQASFTLSLGLHGVAIGYAGNHRLFTEELNREFSRFVTGTNRIPADIKINLYDLDSQPHLAHEITRLRGSGHNLQEADFRRQITQIVDYTDFSLNMFAQADWNPDELLLVLIGSLGGMLRYKLGRRFKLAGFHAASLAWEGQGMLLAGDTGAGKTTISYLCAQAGFAYLSDEDSIVKEGDNQTWHILAYPRRIRLSPDIVEYYPRLIPESHPSRIFKVFNQPGFLLNPHQIIPESYLPAAPLKVGVILNNDRHYTNAPKISLLSKAKARLWLLHSLESAIRLDDPSPAYPHRQGFYLVDGIIESISIFELRYNICKHLLLVPNLLREVLNCSCPI